MNDSRFDAFTRWAARPTTRRTALVARELGLLPWPLRGWLRKTLRRSPSRRPRRSLRRLRLPGSISALFVQTGGATTLTPGTDDVHTLTITGVTAQTLYFSDRPNRVTGAMPTTTFVGLGGCVRRRSTERDADWPSGGRRRRRRGGGGRAAGGDL